MLDVGFDPTHLGPLRGLRVLDLSRLVAGNMLSLQLADFGAEVIKVEDPDGGDSLRQWRERGPQHPEGVEVWWKVYARNKKSLAVDLRSEAGRAVLRTLVTGAQVLIESFRPGTLEKMGFAPDTLLALNSRLVIVRLTGWGQTGPYHQQPGFGSLVEAMSGFAAKNGAPEAPPMLPNMALADMVAGLYGAFAVCAAVREVETQGGAGQVVDLSLLEPLLSIMGPDAAAYHVSGQVPARTGNRTSITAPRNIYRTQDGGWVALSASTQGMAERLLRAIDRADLIDDPRFRTNADRLAHVDALDAVIGAFMGARTLEDNLAFFREREVTVSPVYHIGQIVTDPHVVERGVLVRTPDADVGSLPMHAVVPRLSATPGGLARPAPRLGEHSLALLRAAGMSESELQDLIARKVIAS
ncbi:CoA transferase [Hydrogenophaga sp.]|uniref:CaiB/BaiF CoA transferase family protein n=1 Tax=Hydrogenophaga sp. TaxID=1904254 RepID=UPI00261CA3EA|nr:CoA transferase [Hydrogenophaga sp.]MCW5654558.1 CoA transferase [Hydrogenophaga sp.]